MFFMMDLYFGVPSVASMASTVRPNQS